MRKVIFQEWITMDGYAADSKGSTSFFESPELSENSDHDLVQFMDGIDTILLGRKTYDMFVEYWPQATTDKELIADILNSTPKIVFSKSLKSAPWGKWPAAEVESGDVVAKIKKLKQQPGKNMVLWGSIKIAQVLMKEGLIDEYHFRIVPKLLGSGRSLFEDVKPMELDLFFSKQYPSGLMLLQYKRQG